MKTSYSEQSGSQPGMLVSSPSSIEDEKVGRVSLVGAGPGDPDLLTIKALKTIQTADVIVFDNLVSEAIRALFPQSSKTLYVGKAKGCHSATQDEINQLIISTALSGQHVCRVKGGDSFVFGRGGEEMLMLAQHGIKVDVIPGITAASGCTSYAQIPLTHRGIAQGCTFITAHAEKTLDMNWDAIAQLNQTLVVYMGLSQTQHITDKLISAGMQGDTPVALIEKGCTPDQRTVTGHLNELTALKEQHQLQSPTLIVVGHVVTVSQKMQWLTQLSETKNGRPTSSSNMTAPLKLTA